MLKIDIRKKSLFLSRKVCYCPSHKTANYFYSIQRRERKDFLEAVCYTRGPNSTVSLIGTLKRKTSAILSNLTFRPFFLVFLSLLTEKGTTIKLPNFLMYRKFYKIILGDIYKPRGQFRVRGDQPNYQFIT